MSITPMKRVKGSMDNFKNLVSEHFEIKQLEQRDERVISKYRTHNYKPKTIKGIQTDFKLIFQSENFDIAITFDYLNKEQEDHSIQISISKEDFNKNSIFFEVSEFNSLLKQMNKKIKSFSSDNFYNELFKHLDEEFIKEEFNFDLELENATNEVTSFLEQKKEELNISKYQTNANKANKTLREAENYIKQEIESTDEFKELQKLKERMFELESFLKNKESSLSQEVNLEEKRELFRISNTALENTKKEFEQASEDIKSKQKSVLRRKL